MNDPAQVGRSAKRQDNEDWLGPKGEHAVHEVDAPTPSNISNPTETGEGRGVLIELPWPPKELSGHHDIHWRVLQPIKKKHRDWAFRAALSVDMGIPISETGDIRVSATFYPPDKRTDRVNMPTRLKPYWDGIADALKVNDRRFLPAYHFAEPVKNARVVIAIGAA